MDKNIVLFLDRGNDKFITDALDAMKLFLEQSGQNHSICHDQEYQDNDFGIIYGIPSKYKYNTLHRFNVHQKQRESKRPILVIERGFLKRDIYYSIGWNSIVGFGYYCNQNMPSDRFDQLDIQIHPQRTNSDGFILICGQVPWDSQLHHINYGEWLSNLVKEIRKYTERKIVFRPHPKQNIKNPKAIWRLEGTDLSTNKSILDDIRSAFVVIAFNSNSLVESMIEGVPFYSFDQGSMVNDLANHHIKEIENPKFPTDEERLQKLCDISYAQWNLDEIKNGVFWDHIKKGMEQSLENDNHIQVPLLIPKKKKK